MADEEGENGIKIALDAVQVVQSMIDVSADRLEGLRTQCATSAELTQQEIRTLEGKLIKLFSRQLVTKATLKGNDLPADFENIPCLKQWLRVVGLSAESIEMVVRSVTTLEGLQERADRELRTMLNAAPPHDVRRLTRAMHNLKKYMETLSQSGSVTPGSAPSSETEMALYWDSWERRGSPRAPRHPRSSRPHQHHGEVLQPPPPPPPPPSSPHPQRSKGNKFPTTPPPRRRLQTGLAPPPNTGAATEPVHSTLTPMLSNSSLTKSHSHESQLSVNITGDEEQSERGSHTRLCGGNGDIIPIASPSALQSPPPLTSLSVSSGHATLTPVLSNDDSKSTNSGVPRSPRTPTVSRGMGHYIAHRFAKTFKMIATCDYCDKQMLFGAGLKCKECKYKCHRDCESKVPPSCGLPQEFVDEFRRKMQYDGAFVVNHSPSSMRSPQHAVLGGTTAGGAAAVLLSLTHRARKRSHPFQMNSNAPSYPGGPDSSSNTSSCNSSTPSSPALLGGSGVPSVALGVSLGAGAPPTAPQTPRTPLATHIKQHFHFPEVKNVSSASSVGNHHPHYVHHTPLHHQSHNTHHHHHHHHHTTPNTPHHEHHSAAVTESTRSGGDFSRTVSLSGSASTDEERTPARADSTDGETGGREGSGSQTSTNPGSIDHTTSNSHWPRQNSLSMKEWDIPYDELRIGEVVGKGRFGTVYRGYWHGDVAVKLLNVQYLQADNTALDNFKHEVATFRKTRHENLVLFMGACMKPPRLAIVASLCKGNTLYTHIHLRREKFNMNKTTIVAQQISQGMGYLHARGIVHKDLKSKNIFLENGKVVITDFGLFSVTKLCFGNSGRCDSLGIPAGWLCYLAPELVRALRPHADLPFSAASDVYAFGTVWYELLCGEWPFKGQPPEAVIWQVGKGMKQTLNNLQASRDVKDILMLCWSYRTSERPDFPSLLNTLERLPRKRLSRSPSHPIHLSRSAESVF